MDEITKYIAVVVWLYWVVCSAGESFYAKNLQNVLDVALTAPLFMAWYKCVISALVCWAYGICGKVNQSNQRPSPIQYNPLPINEGGETATSGTSNFTGKARRILPLSVVDVGVTALNILRSKFAHTSIYYHGQEWNYMRSLTFVFIPLFSWALISIPTSFKVTLCLDIIVIGYYMGVTVMPSSSFGIALGFMSSIFVSLNNVLIKKFLPVVENNHWELTFYDNLITAFLITPFMLIFECNYLMAASEQLVSPAFWFYMTACAICVCPNRVVSVLQIKVTSPLSHRISFVAHSALSSLISPDLWYCYLCTKWDIYGAGAILLGSLLYTFVKMYENSQVDRSPPEGRQQEMTSNV